LLELENFFPDNKSKILFDQIINLRETLDPKCYIYPEGVEYFRLDVPILDNLKVNRFVDCGAYIGDAIVLYCTPKVNNKGGSDV
jgi:hypothetical protein